MRKMTVTQNDDATWSADGTIRTDLEKSGVITRIDATVEVTPSATLDGANQADGLFRVIQNLRIAGGNHTYFNLPATDGAGGGVLLHYLNRLDGFGVGHENGDVSGPSETYVPINFVLHPGSRPKDMYNRDNPFDLSAGIPASAEGVLTAEWTTSGNDVMDDTVTISSATMRFTLHRVQGSEQEVEAEIQRQGVHLEQGSNLWIPANSSRVHSNSGTTTDYDAETEDITPGAFLKRIAMLSQDATSTRPGRASDQVTDFAIKAPGSNERLYAATVEHQLSGLPMGTNLEADDAGPTFNGHAPEGFYTFDARPRAVSPIGRDYGWDMRHKANGDLQIGFIISNYASGDETLILFERYMPTRTTLAAA